MGIFVIFITTVFGTFLILFMPIAARVPKTVEITLEIQAIIIVLISEEIIILLLKRRIYQSRVNPLKTLRLFVSLKENTISTKMGTYRKNSTSPRYTLPNFFIAAPPT
jgi:hypothetical protein